MTHPTLYLNMINTLRDTPELNAFFAHPDVQRAYDMAKNNPKNAESYAQRILNAKNPSFLSALMQAYPNGILPPIIARYLHAILTTYTIYFANTNIQLQACPYDINTSTTTNKLFTRMSGYTLHNDTLLPFVAFLNNHYYSHVSSAPNTQHTPSAAIMDAYAPQLETRVPGNTSMITQNNNNFNIYGLPEKFFKDNFINTISNQEHPLIEFTGGYNPNTQNLINASQQQSIIFI